MYHNKKKTSVCYWNWLMSWLVFNKSLIIAAADVYNGWRVGSWQIISFHLPKILIYQLKLVKSELMNLMK